MNKLLALGILSALLAVSCSKKQEATARSFNEEKAAESPRHKMIEGQLVKLVRRLNADPNAEDCDRQWTARKEEIALAIDSRAEEIAAEAKRLPPPAGFRREELGPTWVRVPDPQPSPLPGWIEDTRSWADIARLYDRVKDMPVNAGWIELNRRARSVLVEDESRIVDGRNYFLEHDSGPAIESAYVAASRCMTEPGCIAPAFDELAARIMESNAHYRAHKADIVNAIEPEEKRAALRRMRARLRTDRTRYQFRPDRTVIRKNAAELELTLDPGPFKGVEAQFASYVESIWKNATHRLKLAFGERSPESTELYKVFLGANPGDRAYLDSSEAREMHLVPGVRSRSIAHEMGHILGFRDHYYTVWKPAECRYADQISEEDIMSDMTTGWVTAAEWEKLLESYPEPLPEGDLE